MSNETESGLAQLRDVVPNMVPDDSGDTQHAEKSESGKEGGANSKKHKRVALCVGIDQYGEMTGINSLDYACRDAREIGSVLSESGFKVEYLLSEKKQSNKSGRGNKPTPEKIKSCISDIVRRNSLKLGDVFLFYFAGHGCFYLNGEKSHQTLICYGEKLSDVQEGRGRLSVQTVEQYTRNELGKPDHDYTRIMIIDACQTTTEHEPSPIEYEVSSVSRNVKPICCDTDEAIVVKAANEHNPYCVINACKPKSAAHESPDAGHGYFTDALLNIARNRKVGEDLKIGNDRSLMKEIKRVIDDRAECEFNDHKIKEEAYSALRNQQPDLIMPDGLEIELLPQKANNSHLAIDDSSQTTLYISNETCKVAGNMPGYDGVSINFMFFEALSRYLYLLQGLGSYEKKDAATSGKNDVAGEGNVAVFGRDAFRDSAYQLLSKTYKSGEIICPSLTKADESAIVKAGGFEALAREKKVWSVYKELEMELKDLGKVFSDKLGENWRNGDSLILVRHISEMLKLK